MHIEQALFLIFNHNLTDIQQHDAKASLNAERIIDMPESLKVLWRQIPADLPEIKKYTEPIRDWLKSSAKKGDAVLIQGDFGATFLMVRFAISIGLVPVYSTTVREAIEEPDDDGTVKLVHRFKHRMFRKYEEN